MHEAKRFKTSLTIIYKLPAEGVKPGFSLVRHRKKNPQEFGNLRTTFSCIFVDKKLKLEKNHVFFSNICAKNDKTYYFLPQTREKTYNSRIYLNCQKNQWYPPPPLARLALTQDLDASRRGWLKSYCYLFYLICLIKM